MGSFSLRYVKKISTYIVGTSIIKLSVIEGMFGILLQKIYILRRLGVREDRLLGEVLVKEWGLLGKIAFERIFALTKLTPNKTHTLNI